MFELFVLISKSNNDWIKFYCLDVDTIDKVNEDYADEGLKLLLKIL